jgi:hypothetical protein
MVEEERVTPRILKPRIAPTLEKYPDVGINMEGMGILNLGIETNGNEDTVGVPHIEGPIEKGIEGVGPMVIREGNVVITGMPPVPLEDGLDGSDTLDETLGPDIV